MLHIGIASYQNPTKLTLAIQGIQAHTDGDWKLLIVDNASPDPDVRAILQQVAASDPRVTVEFREDNIGYVGAVNRILEWADSEGAKHVAYCDNDCIVHTQGWNTLMSDVLDRHHEIAMAVALKYAAFPIPRAGYTEALWGVGCFWMLKRGDALQPPKDIGPWDEHLGHQEEVDYQMRLRLEGWSIAAVDVNIDHQAKATTSAEAQDRITAGVIAWMNKWLRYFCGPRVSYYSASVVRFEDWPLNSLYIEDYLHHKQLEGKFPTGINDNPEEVVVEGRRFELIRVPKWPGLYRDRLI